MRAKLTYANVMSTLAVFLALGGGAFAYKLGRNSVGSREIRDGAVKLRDTNPALRLRCPAATRYHEGACIEGRARPAMSWIGAAQACSAAKRRLPDPGELAGFAREPGVQLGSSALSYEWTGNPDAAPTEPQALAAYELPTEIGVTTTLAEDVLAFRCVANARR